MSIDPNYIYPGFIDEVKGTLNQGGGSGGSGGFGGSGMSGGKFSLTSNWLIITSVIRTQNAIVAGTTPTNIKDTANINAQPLSILLLFKAKTSFHIFKLKSK